MTTPPQLTKRAQSSGELARRFRGRASSSRCSATFAQNLLHLRATLGAAAFLSLSLSLRPRLFGLVGAAWGAPLGRPLRKEAEQRLLVGLYEEASLFVRVRFVQRSASQLNLSRTLSPLIN